MNEDNIKISEDNIEVSEDNEKINEEVLEENNQEIIETNEEIKENQALGLSSITKAFEEEIDFSKTKFYKGSLRSGQRVESEGSLVVLGDVNSGAEVIASENIVVLGKLRGLAHAGAKGNQKAIISAGYLDTVQIRIANIIKQLSRQNLAQEQAYVYVRDNNVIIEMLREK